MPDGIKVGQFCSLDANRHPTLAGQRFEITEVVGEGKNAKVAVRNDKGQQIALGKWTQFFDANDLVPAPAILKPDRLPRIVSSDAQESVQMTATETKLLNLAETIAKTKGISLRDATLEANRQLTADECDEIRGGVAVASKRAASKSANESDGVMRLRAEVSRRMRDEGLSADDAVNAVLCEQLPDSGAVRFSERVAVLKSGGLDDLAALRQASAEDPVGAEAYRVGF